MSYIIFIEDLVDLLLDLDFNLSVFEFTGLIPVLILNHVIKYGDTKF